MSGGMGTLRRSRRLLGLTPDIPEFYSCDDREKLLYIESNLRRVIRLRELLDAALAAAHVNIPGRVQNFVGHEGSTHIINTGSLEGLLDLHERQRLEGAIEASSAPSSSSNNNACVIADDSVLNSGGPIRRARGRKRADNNSAHAASKSEGRAPRARAKRRSVITVVDDDDETD